MSDLQKQHISPNHTQIRAMLEILLQNKGDLQPLGDCFITRFVRHHAELKSGRSRSLDAKRMSALDPSIVEDFFTRFIRLKTEYSVENEDIYNIDETGFQIGQSHSEYVVFNSTQGPPLTSVSENTHWVSTVECIAPNQAIRPI
jgi:hypothetical protein